LPLPKVIDRNADSLPVVRSLNALKVACYYGCLSVRPKEIAEADSVENPQIIDRLMKLVGAEPVDWAFKTECCGASMPFPRPDMVVKLAHKILANAKGNGAECLVVACPMCHANLDMRQREIEAKYRDEVGLPVIYFTQLLALAAGIPASKLLFEKHFTDPMPLLREKGLA
ncbi:MAG: heterodisulfide reductase-related iron-sulfur binding cluster, partial [Chloroflexota bacterium]